MERHTFRTSRKLRYCTSRMDAACTREIEPGDRYCDAVLSPQHDDLGNEGWWRAPLCVPCAGYYGYVDPQWPDKVLSEIGGA